LCLRHRLEAVAGGSSRGDQSSSHVLDGCRTVVGAAVVHQNGDVAAVEFRQRHVGGLSPRLTRAVAPVQRLKVVAGQVVTQLLRTQDAQGVLADLFAGGSSVRQPKRGRRLPGQRSNDPVGLNEFFPGLKSADVVEIGVRQSVIADRMALANHALKRLGVLHGHAARHEEGRRHPLGRQDVQQLRCADRMRPVVKGQGDPSGAVGRVAVPLDHVLVGASGVGLLGCERHHFAGEGILADNSLSAIDLQHAQHRPFADHIERPLTRPGRNILKRYRSCRRGRCCRGLI
jgi:hypothetical protein